jgi:polyhydroxyalkanoate synthase subunit PhaC
MTSLRETVGTVLQRSVQGVKAIAAANDIAVGMTPREQVWALNKARLYRYHPDRPVERRHRVPLLLVYALINKPYIFDLRPGRSFVEFMLGQGFDVYLLDWGIPRIEDRHTRFDDYAAEYLPRAVRRVLAISGARDLAMLGYCIGATLAIQYAAIEPDAPIRAIVLLAAPLDFAPHDPSVFTRWLDERYFDVDKLVDSLGNVPADLIEFGSKMLKPVENYVGVYASVWDRLDDQGAIESWQAMHKWVHDGVPFAGAAFRQWVNDYIRGNKLIGGELIVRGRRVDLANVRAPLLNVVAQHDHIVPRSYSEAIMGRVSSRDKRLEVVPSGHVGLMGGSGARQRLWPKIADWLGEVLS